MTLIATFQFLQQKQHYLKFQDGEILGAAVKNLTATSKNFSIITVNREFSGFLNGALLR
jgi:hypothetical protein